MSLSGIAHRALRILVAGGLLWSAQFVAAQTHVDVAVPRVTGLHSLVYHPIRFNVPPEYLTDKTQDEVRARLVKMVDDLNVLWARQTHRRFVFDPATDVTFFPHSGVGTDTEPLNFLRRDHAIKGYFVPQQESSSAGFEQGGGTTMRLAFGGKLHDRDVPASFTSNGPVSFDPYWFQLMTISHEILHGFGAGGPEYYASQAKADTTGVAPDLSRNFANDRFLYTLSDYADDPLRGGLEQSDAPIAERLTRTRFAELTVAHANGRMRYSVGADPYYAPDLTQTRVRIVAPDGVTPVPGARVRVWQTNTYVSVPFVPIVDALTDVHGEVPAPWQLLVSQSERSVLLIKAESPNGEWPTTGIWYNYHQAQEFLLMKGQDHVDIHLAFEGNAPRPTLSQMTLFAGQEDAPLQVTFEQLLAASDAVDPQGLPLKFRIERFASGALVMNGVPVNEGATLIGPGDVVTWTPPLNIRDDAFPAFVLRAHNGSSTSDGTATVRVALASMPDLPRADDLHFELDEDGDIEFELVVDDPEGGPVPSVVITAPPIHGQLTPKAGVPIAGFYRIFRYVPTSDFNGTDTVTYAAQGPTGTSAPATLSFHVAPKNDNPSLLPLPAGGVAAVEDQPVLLSVAALLAAGQAHSTDGKPLQMRVTSLAAGTLLRAGAPVAVSTLLPPSETLTWIPPLNQVGLTDAFAFVADDGWQSNPATVRINLTPVNDFPGFSAPMAATLAEDGNVCVPLTNVGPGGGVDEANQALTFTLLTSNYALLPNAAPNLTVTGSGSSRCLNVTPAANANGSGVITVTIADNGGGIQHVFTRTLTINVTAVNDAPTYVSGSGTFTSTGISSWTRLFPNLVVNDVDAGNSITCKFVGALPENVEITTASGSHTSVSATTYYPIATFRNFWIVKRSVLSGGTETKSFHCRDQGGAITGSVAYTVVAS